MPRSRSRSRSYSRSVSHKDKKYSKSHKSSSSRYKSSRKSHERDRHRSSRHSKHSSSSRNRSRRRRSSSSSRSSRSSSSSTSSGSRSSRSTPEKQQRSVKEKSVEEEKVPVFASVDQIGSNISSKTFQELNEDSFSAKTFTSGVSKKPPSNIVIDIISSNPRVEVKAAVTEESSVPEDTLFHQNLYGNDAARMEKWVKKLYAFRQRTASGI